MFIILSYIVAVYWFYHQLRRDVLSDFRKWVQNIPVKHTKEAIMRVINLSPSFALILWPKLYWHHNFWLASLTSAGIIFSIWWEFFDGWYNKIRGFHWRFNGSVDKDDSFLDKFLYGIGGTWETLLKWGLIILALIGYILLK